MKTLEGTFVLLDCGHWFTESCPEGTSPPEQGELRVCGVPDHHPRQFPAHYIAVKVDE